MKSDSSLALQVSNLTKRFGEVVAVNDISFQVNKGELFGFLGPNGAGKTTTLRIISTILKATSGNVIINNKNKGCYSIFQS